MDSAELRAVQEPLKDSYRQNPREALITLRAHGQLDDQAKRLMTLAGHTEQTVLPRGEVFYLRGTGNLSTGGTAINRAISFTSRATPLRESIRGHFWKGGSLPRSWKISGGS